MENDFLQLPFSFDIKRLLLDFENCLKYSFIPHFNTSNYSGDWNSISLRSSDGQIQSIHAHAEGAENYKDTPLLKECSYFKEIIDTFKCKKEAIRLLNLTPGSYIKEHTDHNLGYEDGCFRIHIPITTNDQVYFYINGKRVLMKPAECWYGNFNLSHKVSNQGQTNRIHLIIDCIRNEWTDQIFKEAGYNFEQHTNAPEHSDAVKIRMIEELERMGGEASKKIIAELKKDLNH